MLAVGNTKLKKAKKWKWEYRREVPTTYPGKNVEPALRYGCPLISVLGEAKRRVKYAEDEHGTYIMNSKICALSNTVRATEWVCIQLLKIEGRAKSFYCARTAQMYNRAIDGIAGKPFVQHC